MAADCRSLIEFCRAFEQHHNGGGHRSRRPRAASQSPPPSPSLPFCARSPSIAIDAVMLLATLVAIGVLAAPYCRFAAGAASELLPPAMEAICAAISGAPIAHLAGAAAAIAAGIAAWELVGYHSRRCGSPYCKGLRKAVEFDIQLESEECVRCLPPVPQFAFGDRPLDLGRDREVLEAELKKMAPPNGRTVLIFRRPCGCPLGRMEVWGHKKVRRIKK